jgi:hypothetical protein
VQGKGCSPIVRILSAEPATSKVEEIDILELNKFLDSPIYLLLLIFFAIKRVAKVILKNVAREVPYPMLLRST